MTNSLRNKKILITREAEAAKQFAKQIRKYGGEPVLAPLLEIRCLPYVFEGFAEGKLAQFEWIFFTSVNGVRCFLNQSPNIESCKIAAVGPKTAKAVEESGYAVDFIPSTYNAEVMAKEFFSTYPDSGHALFVRGNLASSVLLDAFTKANKSYKCVEIYETTINMQAEACLRAVLREQSIDFVTFTSPSTIDAFLQLTIGEPIPKKLPVVCIGTTTEAHAREVGFTKTIVPENFTIEGMIEVMSREMERSQ